MLDESQRSRTIYHGTVWRRSRISMGTVSRIHSSNRKWFAVTMRISADKLGIPGKIMVDILNVKCNTSVIASLLEEEPGFYPAYHMNKKNWISILLDDSVSAQKISWMVDKSYELTAIKSKKKQK